MMEGQHIGRYRIEGTLGSGAMGVVYHAFDTQIQRPVALKTIRKELMVDDQRESLMARFLNEVKAAGRLVHPNIVTVFDYGEENGTAFIAMELVEGKGLNRLVAKGQRVDRGLVVNWVSQLLTALEFAHSQGIIHRDIKPANLLVTPLQQLKITDFGVAKIDTTTMTQMGSIVGTPSYMSPEQFRGEVVDGRADVFSAAVILYQLLTGTRPFQGSPTAVMHGIMNVNPARPSEVCEDIPSRYDEVVMKGLEKLPADRYAKARDFRKALLAAYREADPQEISEEPWEEENLVHDHSADDTNIPMVRSGSAGRRPGTPAAPAPAPLNGGTAAPAPTGSGGAHVTHGGTSVSNWDPVFLQDLEHSLTSHLGPVAGPLVRKMASQCHDVEELSARIVEKGGSAEVKARMREALNTLSLRHAGRLALTAGSHPGHPASAPGTPPRTGSGIGPNQLQEVERMLLPHVGPIASVLVRRTAGKAVGTHQFYMMLAEHITDGNKRAKFLKDVGLG